MSVVLGGKGMRRCIPFDFCSVFLCLLFWGERECADAFRLISVLSFYVCCFGGKGMRRCIRFYFSVLFGGKGMRICIPFDFCSVFLCLLFWGERECADAFRLISVLSFYVCCFWGKRMRRCIPFDLCLLFWGKGMRRCIPFDFCSVFLCLLFWGEGNAQMHSV